MMSDQTNRNTKEKTTNAKKPNRLRITQLWLKGLRAPQEGRVIYWDTDLPGFGLRISAAQTGRPARAVWIVAFRPRRQK